jgi:hypothetical protein
LLAADGVLSCDKLSRGVLSLGTAWVIFHNKRTFCLGGNEMWLCERPGFLYRSKRCFHKTLRRELALALVLKLALLVALKSYFLPAKLSEQQAASGVAERLAGISAMAAPTPPRLETSSQALSPQESR